MMHLKSNKTGVADLADFSGYITSKQNSVLSLTKLVIIVSAVLAIVMLVSK